MLPVMDLIVQQQPHGASASNVPAFLAKLWKMVDDPDTNHLIAWSDEGRSFIIHNQAEFAQSLLPYYYKHSNMASFVRQLNMYGFHKVVGVDTGGLKSERQEEMEFAHQFFVRGNEGMLDKIKRKVSANKTAQFVPAMKTERVNEVLNEVSLIRDKQEDLDGKLDTMKKENEALWREVVNLRQKHQSQQKIVNKLIQFLVSMVQPRMTQAVKRRYPNQLAIEDTYPHGGKEQRIVNTPNINEVTDIAALDTSGQATLIPTIEMPSTPEANNSIHPTAGLLAATNVQQQMGRMAAGSSQARPVTPVAPAMQPVDPTTLSSLGTLASLMQPSSSGGTMTVATSPAGKSTALTVSPKRPQLHREISREDFDYEMNIMQNDLDKVKDFLSAQITLDTSVISTLFSPEEPLTSLLPDAVASTSDLPKLQMELQNSDASGVPSFFELADIEDDGNVSGIIQIPLPKGSAGQDLDLNTPLVQADNQNPLVASLKK